jgi:DNA mismatch repair protein MutL
VSIRVLKPHLINQIAAGEVVERPSSVIKELVENSIDAGATKINISIRNGGGSFICVKDNGSGMGKHDLELCVKRHATSKISDENLFDIRTFGFRGEALPSISSIARVQIDSYSKNEKNGWSVKIEGGNQHETTPSSIISGTYIEVRDLFFATPARLKFMKSSSTEQRHCLNIVQEFALSYPNVEFSYKNEKNTDITYNGDLDNRILQILGKDFYENSIKIESTEGDRKLSGYISLPIFNKNNSVHQHIFVNRRPVNDKTLSSAFKLSYRDVLESNRHPCGCLFLEIPYDSVDVNVHPAKTEVRFENPNDIKGFVMHAISNSLRSQKPQSSTKIDDNLVQSIYNNYTFDKPISKSFGNTFFTNKSNSPIRSPQGTSYSFTNKDEIKKMSFNNDKNEIINNHKTELNIENTALPMERTLGHAVAHLFENYILAQNKNDEVIIIDQHAAHERIIYESLKNNEKISSQYLAIPEIINLTDNQMNIFKNHISEFNKYGFVIDEFGKNAINIQATPSILNQSSIKTIIIDVCDELLENKGSTTKIEDMIFEKLSSHACHTSIRSGRILSIDEMNALLRSMEQTSLTSQCNHGRPTFIKLSKKNLEKLFHRI